MQKGEHNYIESAKGTPKKLNLATIGIKYILAENDVWMFSKDQNICFRNSSIDICIKNYNWNKLILTICETKLTEKWKKWKLNSGSYIIACNFLHNMHRLVLFSQPCIQGTLETRSYPFLIIWPMINELLVFIYCFENFFLFSIMCRCSLQYVWYFSLYGIFWNSTCLLIHVGVVNKRLSLFFRTFIKLPYILRKYFIARYAFTSVHAMKKAKNRMIHQVVPHTLSKTIWELVLPSYLKVLWFSTAPCICNYQQQLQDTWTWIHLHSSSFYLTSVPLAQPNLKRLTW